MNLKKKKDINKEEESKRRKEKHSLQNMGKITEKESFESTKCAKCCPECNGIVKTFLLSKDDGTIQIEISNFGGTILAIRTPDKLGNIADIALGVTDSIHGWMEQEHPYFGSTVGRVCNRIHGGEFPLEGKTIQVSKNENGVTTLHGGFRGFSDHIWTVDSERTVAVPGSHSTLSLMRTSKDGEEGFPGELCVRAEYTLTECGKLKILFTAELVGNNVPVTVVNMTNHLYLNLSGKGSQSTILDHVLQLNASKYTPLDEKLATPKGPIESLIGTHLDFFTVPKKIGDEIEDPRNAPFRGYDHNFVLDKRPDNGDIIKDVPEYLNFAAALSHEESGRSVKVFTTQPAIQIYTGNYLDGVPCRDGSKYPKWAGVALETQHSPDSPNHSNFPSIALHAGEKFREETWFVFK